MTKHPPTTPVAPIDDEATTPWCSAPGNRGLQTAAQPSGRVGAWEPFQNRTHNGVYWAIRRRNRAMMGGVEIMLNLGGSPRRFGSEGAAQGGADVANRDGWPALRDALSEPEQRLLRSYLADICHGAERATYLSTREEFVTRVMGMEIEGPVDAQELQAARKLRARKHYVSFREERRGHNRKWLSIRFSATGAGALFDEMRRNMGSDSFVRTEVARVLEECVDPVDAYKVARKSGLVDAMQAARGLQALHGAGRARKVQGDGDNGCAWTYEATFASSASEVGEGDDDGVCTR